MHVKLEIKCIQTSRKEKFPKQSVVILLKNGCSVRYMFCTILAPLSVAKGLEKHIRNSSLSIGLFQEHFTVLWKIYWTVISITITLHQNFQTDIFQNSFFWLVIKKSTKFINENGCDCGLSKLLSGNYVYGKLFCIRQTLHLSQFYRVSLADLCALLINTFQKLPLINPQANLWPSQNLKWSFLWY